VPLRILALGRQPQETVEADVYLLTDHAPNLLPDPAFTDGLSKTHASWASDQLLNDLRSDVGMGWVPESAFLTKVEIASDAPALEYDLAIDATGLGKPSAVDAGLEWPVGRTISSVGRMPVVPLLLIGVALIPVGLMLEAMRRTSTQRTPGAGAA
jgi:hypothetical protein